MGTAFQFGVIGAANSMREALSQVFHRDQFVRNNVAMMYKKIYLDMNNKRQTVDPSSNSRCTCKSSDRITERIKAWTKFSFDFVDCDMV